MTDLAILGSFRAFKYKIMYEHRHRRRQSLKLHMFFKIKFLLYKKKNIVVDGCARGKLFHRQSEVAVTSLITGLGTSIMYIRRTHCHSREHFMMLHFAIKS